MLVHPPDGDIASASALDLFGDQEQRLAGASNLLEQGQQVFIDEIFFS